MFPPIAPCACSRRLPPSRGAGRAPCACSRRPDEDRAALRQAEGHQEVPGPGDRNGKGEGFSPSLAKKGVSSSCGRRSTSPAPATSTRGRAVAGDIKVLLFDQGAADLNRRGLRQGPEEEAAGSGSSRCPRSLRQRPQRRLPGRSHSRPAGACASAGARPIPRRSRRPSRLRGRSATRSRPRSSRSIRSKPPSLPPSMDARASPHGSPGPPGTRSRSCRGGRG